MGGGEWGGLSPLTFQKVGPWDSCKPDEKTLGGGRVRYLDHHI